MLSPPLSPHPAPGAAVGKAQELMMLVDSYWDRIAGLGGRGGGSVPIYMALGMIR